MEARRTLFGLVLVICLAPLPSSASLPVRPSDPGSSESFTVVGASPAQLRQVAVALAGFEQAGLEPSAAVITFVEGLDACRGYYGYYRPGNPATITVCEDMEFVLTHELAHAWIDANVDAQARQAYLDLRGLETWNDEGVDWRHRGTEDAAFVIQQNLMTTRLVPDDDTWRGRALAYELLTGLDSPLQFERPDAAPGS